MSSRKRGYKVVITRSKNQSNVKLKQTKISDWLGSHSNSKENLSDSDSSIQSCSSSSSSVLLLPNKPTSAPSRNGSKRLKQSTNATRRAREDISQLQKILIWDAPNCNYQTSFKENLDRHKKVKHELKRLQCPNCEFVTDSEDALNRHKSTHDSNVTLKCRLCSWTTSVPSLLKNHMTSTHERVKLREQGITKASGKRFKCSKCDFQAVKKQEIQLHNDSHERDKYKCSFPSCNYKSKTVCSLIEHVKSHDVEAFRCPLCSKLFWTKNLLDKHIQYLYFCVLD